MVVNYGGQYRLEPLPGCVETFRKVTVEYLPPEGAKDWEYWNLEMAWYVTFAPDSNVTSVALFEPAPDAVEQMDAESVDLGREMKILWEYENGNKWAGLAGVLADLGDGKGLWGRGVDDAVDLAGKGRGSNVSCHRG